MAWTDPITRVLSDLITPAIWTSDIKDNLDHLKRGVVGKAVNFTADEEEAMVYIVDTSGGVINVTLPDPTTVTVASILIQRNGGTNAVGIIGTVNGVVNPSIGTDGDWMLLVSDGTVWRGAVLTGVT